MEGLPVEALMQVASYFQTLSEPTPLLNLDLWRQRERSVGKLGDLCSNRSANISRHLTLLTQRGLVADESRGNSAINTIADQSVYSTCDLVCSSIVRQFERTAEGRAAFVTSAAMQAASR